VLADLGAKVSVESAPGPYRTRYPAAHADEKEFVSAATAEILRARADVVLMSSDVSPGRAGSLAPHQICCDLTAYGTSGPMAGRAHADPLLQAVTGLADTTGEPDAPPALCRFPVTEGIAALYAAAGVLTALIVRQRKGSGQSVEIALFDCACSTLSTFVPFHFVGKPVTRSGNRHVLASPWNTYRARDAWLVICTGSDDQWLRLCRVIGRRDLAADPRLTRAQDRVLHRAVVDEAVQRWIESLDAADAANALQAQGVAAGPVVPADALAREPNLRHRALYSERGLRSAIRRFPCPAAGASQPHADTARFAATGAAGSDLPLAGVQVIELGQYTTAPFVARHLGALGAEVLKIEPPGGDATRAWPPQRDGLGYFFSLSNSDKASCCLDLRDAAGRAQFARLLADADVLVENLKPGSLEKFGFDAAARARINPQLAYCAISGFGADSAYPGRPAFDTVIQAMSGIMDSIRQNDRPQKAGISLADILGGLFALTGTLSALVGKAATGSGDALDISMQDAAAWITQWRETTQASGQVATLKCADGYVVALSPVRECGPIEQFLGHSRTEVAAALQRRGIASEPVLSVDEVARSEQAGARSMLVPVRDSAGREWQVFNTPIRLSATPASVRRGIGPLGEADAWQVARPG
jgi:crotonobetainyl-CoA:carnitine CoA-transferase CaiB-like acyl-CoA transferase